MTVNNGNHEVAKIIKDLEERIADLEEDDEDESTPQLLRTYYDQVAVSDSIQNVQEITLQEAKWNDGDSGWGTSTW